MRRYETSTELITDRNTDVHSQPRTLPHNALQELTFFADAPFCDKAYTHDLYLTSPPPPQALSFKLEP